MKLPKNTIIICLVVILLLSFIWIADICFDRRHEIEIKRQVSLFEEPPQYYPTENKIVGTIEAGEKTQVLRVGFGKDFRTWKIRGSHGQEGWVIEDDNIKAKRK